MSKARVFLSDDSVIEVEVAQDVVFQPNGVLTVLYRNIDGMPYTTRFFSPNTWSEVEVTNV